MFRTVPMSIIRSVQWNTPDDGHRNCPKHVEFYSKNKFEKLVHLVGFIIRIYHDARSPEHRITERNLYGIDISWQFLHIIVPQPWKLKEKFSPIFIVQNFAFRKICVQYFSIKIKWFNIIQIRSCSINPNISHHSYSDYFLWSLTNNR